jgi:hypothetical protein
MTRSLQEILLQFLPAAHAAPVAKHHNDVVSRQGGKPSGVSSPHGVQPSLPNELPESNCSSLAETQKAFAPPKSLTGPARL